MAAVWRGDKGMNIKSPARCFEARLRRRRGMKMTLSMSVYMIKCQNGPSQNVHVSVYVCDTVK